MSLEVWGDELPDEGIFDAAIEAGWLDPNDLSSALIDVMNERDRQWNEEGFTAEHDDEHNCGGELARAAAYYIKWGAALPGGAVMPLEGVAPHAALPGWPWSPQWWKPTTPRGDLVKAAALILAEIERLDRAGVWGRREGGAA